MNTSLMKDRVILSGQCHVRSITWSPESADVMAVGNKDGVVRMMDLVHGATRRLFTTHTPVHALAWSPDGTCIAAPGAEHTVDIWMVATGGKRRRSYGHQAGVYHRLTAQVHALAWSTDGKRIVSASSDGTMQLWDASTGIHLRTLAISLQGVGALAWSPEMTSILAAVGSSIRGWNMTTGICSFPIDMPLHHITMLTWSPDGKHILCGDDHGSVSVWDLSRGMSVASLPRCEGAVKAAFWGPDDVLHLAFVGPERAVYQREVQL